MLNAKKYNMLVSAGYYEKQYCSSISVVSQIGGIILMNIYVRNSYVT